MHAYIDESVAQRPHRTYVVAAVVPRPTASRRLDRWLDRGCCRGSRGSTGMTKPSGAGIPPLVSSPRAAWHWQQESRRSWLPRSGPVGWRWGHCCGTSPWNSACSTSCSSLDRADAALFGALRRHRLVPDAIRFEHVAAADEPALWLADALAGSVTTGRHTAAVRALRERIVVFTPDA